VNLHPSINMSWLDLTFAVVVLVSIGVGVFRGLIFELLSVTGWFVAYFAAQFFAPQVAPLIPIGAAGSGLNQGAAFAGVFIAALLAWSLIARLLRLLVQRSPLSATDRMLGAAFGMARAAVLLLAVATVVGLTPLSRSTAWQQSSAAVWLDSALRGLKPVLPPDISRHLPT
jgi:membrane protein required for colicin V production